MTKTKSIYLALLAILLSPMAANADLILQIERIDDSTALITGTGLLDVDDVLRFSLLGATSLGDSGADAFTGDLTIGGVGPDNVFTRFGTTNFILVYSASGGGARSAGDAIAGQMLATLDVESWAAVGTAGRIIAEGSEVSLGRYSIVSAVPEPGTLALLGIGLFGMGLARRKKV